MGPRLVGFQEAGLMLEAAVRWSDRAAEVVEIYASADAKNRPLPEVCPLCQRTLAFQLDSE